MPFCPQCKARYTHGSFSCPSCEVILESTAIFEKPITDTPTLVEALLTPEPFPTADPLPASGTDGSLPFDLPINQYLQEVPDSAVLRILDVDLQGQAFTPYEARFLAFVDRRWPAKDVREASHLSPREFAGIVQKLVEKGVIEVQEKTDPSADFALPLPPPRPIVEPLPPPPAISTDAASRPPPP